MLLLLYILNIYLFLRNICLCSIFIQILCDICVPATSSQVYLNLSDLRVNIQFTKTNLSFFSASHVNH